MRVLLFDGCGTLDIANHHRRAALRNLVLSGARLILLQMRVLLAGLASATSALLIWNAAAETNGAPALVAFVLGLPFLAVLGHRTGEPWATGLPALPLAGMLVVGLADDNVPGSWGELWLPNLIIMTALTAASLSAGWALRDRRQRRRR